MCIAYSITTYGKLPSVFFPERVKFVFCKMGRASYGSGIFFDILVNGQEPNMANTLQGRKCSSECDLS